MPNPWQLGRAGKEKRNVLIMSIQCVVQCQICLLATKLSPRCEDLNARIDYGKNCKGKVSPRCLLSIETVETVQVLVSSLDIALRATIVFKQKFAVAAL